MTKRHECSNECHKCLQCGERTFTPSSPARPKKFCGNTCQLTYQYARGEGPKKLPKEITKELMEKMYVKDKRSVLSIGREIGKSIRQVSRYLKLFGIKARPFSTEGLRDNFHWNWQGGKTKKGTAFRNRIEYKRWRKQVFKRDSYTCQMCGKRGGDLQADHIKPFAHYPRLRLELTNGRTLCLSCHRTTFVGNRKK